MKVLFRILGIASTITVLYALFVTFGIWVTLACVVARLLHLSAVLSDEDTARTLHTLAKEVFK